MALQGKGFFTFQLPECEGGDPAAILAAAQTAGLSHIIVKIADGSQAFGADPSGKDTTALVVRTLRAAGIAVWGWHTVYGDDPAGEAEIALRRLPALGLDGYVVTAGSGYKQPGKEAAARAFIRKVRSSLNVPIALNSYRFPFFHPEFPWAAFLEGCDYHMPQVFWEQSHDAGEQLKESKRQCDALPHARPYLATGATYPKQDGWEPTQADVTDFLAAARTLGIPAVNFFSWDGCRKNLPSLWKTISTFIWPVPLQAAKSMSGWAPAASTPLSLPGQPPIAAPDTFTAQYMAALNSHEAAEAVALYDPAAVHVREDKAQRGTAMIHADYTAFFDGLPADTVFTLIQAQIDEDVRHLTWGAGALTGRTTVVLRGGKIVLDYTYMK